MPTYSRLVIEAVFDQIWEDWINKEGEKAAQRAVDVCLKSDNKKEDLIKACKAYTLENLGKDPEFTYKLSNFINQDHWRDVLAENSLELLQQKHNEAVKIINAWNTACKDHWCKSLDIEAKVPMVIKAMSNKAFANDWRKALDKASKIFRYPMRDNDHRSKIILSLRWFTSIVHDKHTVLKLIEGEYGYPIREEVKKIKPVKEVTDEERARLAKDYEEVFQKKLEVIKPPPKPDREPSKQAKKLAQEIIESIGVKLEESNSLQDPFEFT